MYLIPLKYIHLQIGKMVDFVMCILTLQKILNTNISAVQPSYISFSKSQTLNLIMAAVKLQHGNSYFLAIFFSCV